MDAQMMFVKRETESAFGCSNETARIRPPFEECALGMKQRSNYAAVKDYQIKPEWRSLKHGAMQHGWMYK